MGRTFSRIASSIGEVEGDSDVTVDEAMMLVVVESDRKTPVNEVAELVGMALLARPKTVRRNIEVDPEVVSAGRLGNSEV